MISNKTLDSVRILSDAVGGLTNLAIELYSSSSEVERCISLAIASTIEAMNLLLMEKKK